MTNEWVAATKVTNYLLNNPALDWYNIRNKKKGSSSLITMFEKGKEFENKTINKIIDILGEDNVMVVPNCSFRYSNTSREILLTKQYMSQGIPVIVHGCVSNEKNMTYGFPDIIIRSDWINKLIPNSLEETTRNESTEIRETININPENQDQVTPPQDLDYFYVIIEIKWSNIKLCVDGKRVRNTNRVPAYKGQITIYNEALGEMQGYVPSKAFIIGKSYTIRNTTYNCFSKIGIIDYESFDRNYTKKTKDAINWIRKLKVKHGNWSILPVPSVPELYPNMCRPDNVGKIAEDAEELKELTLLWSVGHKNRQKAHNKGIYKYTDSRCNAETLGIVGKTARTLDLIIDGVSQECPVMPRVIKNNLHNWKTATDKDLFLDFETLNTDFAQSNICDVRVTDFVFLVGVGYRVNGTFAYIHFIAKTLTKQSETNLINELISFLLSFGSQTRVFHFTNADVSIMERAARRNEISLDTLKESVTWIDFAKVFKEEPIIIKGLVTGFGLKAIARKMYEHGLIKTIWANTMVADISTIIEWCRFYSDKQIQDCDIIPHAIEYNRKDCEILSEIVCYLRENNT